MSGRDRNVDAHVLYAFILILLFGGTRAGTCPQFSLSYPPNGTYSCPGRNITYTCVLSSRAYGVTTSWQGSAFLCPEKTNQIGLLQRLSGAIQPFTPVSCGGLSAVTTNISNDGICYTSVLTIPAAQALNGTTVICGDGNGTVVGSDTLKITASPGPSGNIAVTNTSVDQLTVAWAPPTTGGVPTSYNVSFNDSFGTCTSMVIPDNGSPTYTRNFTGLMNLTNNTVFYNITVIAINCAGTNSTSIIWSCSYTHVNSWDYSALIIAATKGVAVTVAVIGSGYAVVVWVYRRYKQKIFELITQMWMYMCNKCSRKMHKIRQHICCDGDDDGHDVDSKLLHKNPHPRRSNNTRQRHPIN